MTAADQQRLARARARATWCGEKKSLDAPDNVLVEAPVEVLVAVVRELTLTAWALANRTIPAYGRAEMPGRVLRPPPSA